MVEFDSEMVVRFQDMRSPISYFTHVALFSDLNRNSRFPVHEVVPFNPVPFWPRIPVTPFTSSDGSP